jgi:SpoVK/Ycf46/Vps4 family AAA+-type ATPase
MLKRTFADANRQAPSFIIFDDLHRLCPHRGGNSKTESASAMQVSEQHRSLIASILTLIDGVGVNNHGVFVVGQFEYHLL